MRTEGVKGLTREESSLGPDPFGPEYARQLIPAEDSDRMGRLEGLLMQVIKENGVPLTFQLSQRCGSA